MITHGGSIGSPIVISDDDEDAAFVDRQLQYDDEPENPPKVPIDNRSYSEAQPDSRPSPRVVGPNSQGRFSPQQNYTVRGTFASAWEDDTTLDPSIIAKKRKRDELILPPPNAPQSKKQKKKKNKQKLKPLPPPYPATIESSVFNEYSPSYSTVAHNLDYWPGPSYDSYQAPYALEPLYNRDALLQEQPFESGFHDGYCNPGVAPLYQPAPQPLPLKPTYQPSSPPVAQSRQDAFSLTNPRGSLGNVPSASTRPDERDSEGLGGWPSGIPGSSSQPRHYFTPDADMSMPIPPSLPPPPPRSNAPAAPLIVGHVVVPMNSTAAAPKVPVTIGLSSMDNSSTLPIGMIADSDPLSTHGMFPLPPGKRIKTACAIVMENVPRLFRNEQFVRSWSKRTAGIVPYYHQINDKGKILLVFQSPELARKAFDSPRMTHGKGREGIRVWWYREGYPETQHKKPAKAAAVSLASRPDSAEVLIDLEEGEIEETVPAEGATSGMLKLEHKNPALPVPEPHLSKKARKRLRAAQLHALKTSSTLQAEASGVAHAEPSTQTLRMKNSRRGPWPHLDPSPGGLQTLESSDYSLVAFGHVSGGDEGSIVSSAPGSPSAGAASGLSMHDGVQDMELESPVSPRYPQALQDERYDNKFGRSATFTKKLVQPPPEFASRFPAMVTRRSEVPVDTASWSSMDQFANTAQTVTRPVSIVQPVPQAAVLPSSKTLLAHRQTPPISTPTPPSDTPSEPRAMRNLARGPRSISERTRELEQRLARSKHEMIRPVERNAVLPPKQLTAASSTMATTTSILPQQHAQLPSRPMPTTPADSPALMEPFTQSTDLMPPLDSAPPVPPTEPSSESIDKLSMEENLRRLVLQSRKARKKDQSPTSQTAPSRDMHPILQPPTATEPDPPSGTNEVDKASEERAQATDIVPNALSLEDLAVSFINETIQAAPVPTPASIKIDLAAKQKRLEQHINETKRLMAQLSAASTKAEKEQILGLLREQSRMMDEDITVQPSKNSQVDSSALSGPKSECVPARKISWPETSPDFVLMLSDDEND